MSQLLKFADSGKLTETAVLCLGEPPGAPFDYSRASEVVCIVWVPQGVCGRILWGRGKEIREYLCLIFLKFLVLCVCANVYQACKHHCSGT